MIPFFFLHSPPVFLKRKTLSAKNFPRPFCLPFLPPLDPGQLYDQICLKGGGRGQNNRAKQKLKLVREFSLNIKGMKFKRLFINIRLSSNLFRATK